MVLVCRDRRGGREARRDARDQSSGPASGGQSAGPRRPAPGGSNKATTRKSNAGRVDQFRAMGRRSSWSFARRLSAFGSGVDWGHRRDRLGRPR